MVSGPAMETQFDPIDIDESFNFGCHSAIIREAHCRGFFGDRRPTVREWIENQGLAEYFDMNDRLMTIISMKNRLRPGPLGFRDRLLFRTALYDMDVFRNQVRNNGILEPLGIDTASMDAMDMDDNLLLEWGHRWVEFALFRGRENRM